MITHKNSSSLAGEIVKIKNHVTHMQFPEFAGSEFHVEDWADRVLGDSWMNMNGNPACLIYAMRGSQQTPRIPLDNEVLYGHVNGMGCLVHITEIEKIGG